MSKKSPNSWCVNILIYCSAENQYRKITCIFFKDFKPKSTLYRLIRQRFLVKMFLMEIILEVKITMNIATTKKLCFGYLCRSLTCALTLTRRNTYVYSFGAFFNFINFKATCCDIQKLGLKLFHFTLNFEQKRPGFLKSHCNSWLLCSKQVERDWKRFFKEFKSKKEL